MPKDVESLPIGRERSDRQGDEGLTAAVKRTVRVIKVPPLSHILFTASHGRWERLSQPASKERVRMKLTNVGPCNTIEEYCLYRIEEYKDKEKSFDTFFDAMFFEAENVMLEGMEGYRIKQKTYGEVKAEILRCAPRLAAALSELPHDALVGLYMGNSPAWITLFWEILACGFRPLLMNRSLPLDTLEGILETHKVAAVISDGTQFSVRTLDADALLVPADAPLSPRPFGTEILLMSSGTTAEVKLCAYTSASLYHQVCGTAKLDVECPAIMQHHAGMLKQLVVLPLYHVFGFVAVYIWYGFFARTFVFPEDLSPDTLRSTVQRHGITHIYAVPLLWEKVAAAAKRQIRGRGARTEKKFYSALRRANRMRLGGGAFSRVAFREVREGLFGDSIRLLISGGGGIDRSALEFFNGIGYMLVNGYGMTEIGITSVETSSRRAMRNTGAIGTPIGDTEYLCDATGELLVRGRVRAARIYQGDSVTETDFDEFFHTNDLVRLSAGRYYHEGRRDDLIVGADGENLNPTLLEPMLSVAGCEAVCLFPGATGEAVLLASVPAHFTEARCAEVLTALDTAIAKAGLSATVRQVHVTASPLIEKGEIKISRRKVKAKYEAGAYALLDRRVTDASEESASDPLVREVTAFFAEALGRDAATVSPSAHFFRELEGTSLDYFTLLDLLKSRYSIDRFTTERGGLFTVNDFCAYIKSAK